LKTASQHIVKTCFVLLSFLLVQNNVLSQGRVVINEYMPWSGCNTTSEFIELMNFGPGPMNIGCYIVTNGTYSVTIPANTTIQPGQYYLLAGQNTLLQNCGNIDSAVQVHLNWTTCNCSNIAIPTTGDGFLKNGGGANEKIVLLDPGLNVVDAVSRLSTPSSSIAIITPTFSGSCTSKTFNLDTMSVSYETISSSTGIDNSFARKVDGDCGWAKTTSISALAPNKTDSTSSASYQFSTVTASECSGTTGSISINVSASNVTSLFPMNYTLAFDADSNNFFNNTDRYNYGTDSSSSSIDINNLLYGRYRITVGSSAGCNLKSFDFYIFNCYGILLPLKLLHFEYEGIKERQHLFRFQVSEAENLKEVVLEADDGTAFHSVAVANGPFHDNPLVIKSPLLSYSNFRLRLTDKPGYTIYSEVIRLDAPGWMPIRYWPNPVQDKMFLQIEARSKNTVSCAIVNAAGITIKEAELQVRKGRQVISISTESLNSGLYYLKLTGTALNRDFSVRFVK
jgi:hypothetical protein